MTTFFVLFYFNAHSQSSGVTSFGLDWANQWAEDGFIDTNGDRYICIKGVELKIARVNSSNQVIWVKNLTSHIQPALINPSHLIKLSDGNYLATYLVSNKFNMVKFSSSGNILFHKEIEEEVSARPNICSSTGGNIIVGINCQYSGYLLIGFDSQGSQIWQKRVNSTENNYYVGGGEVHPLTDGNFVSVTYLNSGFGPQKHMLIKFDHLGNVLWEKCWANQNNQDALEGDMVELSNGDLVFSGLYNFSTSIDSMHALVRKFNSSGDYISGKAYGREFRNIGYGLERNENDEMIMLATMKTSPSCGHILMVVKFNQDLDLIWTKAYGETSASGIQCKELHYYQNDSIYTFGAGGAFSVFSYGTVLLLTDFNFELECNKMPQVFTMHEPEALVPSSVYVAYDSVSLIIADTLVVIDDSLNAAYACGLDDSVSTANLSVQHLGDIVLFPNPTNGLVHISGDLQGARFRLYDSSGRNLRHYPLTSYIDVSDLKAGVYYLIIERGEERIRRKLVKN